MIDITSAKERLRVLRIIRIIALTAIFYSVVVRFHNEFGIAIILSCLIITTGINDFVRGKFLKDHRSILYYLSYILSNTIEAYLSYKVNCSGTLVYNVILIIDALLFNKNTPVFLIGVNFIAFYVSSKFNIDGKEVMNLQKIFFSYLNSFVIVYIFRSIVMDKIGTEKINKELSEANLKLKEYSTKIEELTVSKERTRIAQELHDSIGHSLMALRMNLEYAENVVAIKPEKAKEVIEKAHGISKDCIVKLREVVNVLKEEPSINNLRNGIEQLFDNFGDSERYQFNLNMQDEVEGEAPEIKNCIYKTVMEGITNGIKHGNATVFNIDIKKMGGNIIFSISNNGIKCTDIKKSNGISGIEKRVIDLGGTVKLYAEDDAGFIIDVVIPVRSGKNDKAFNS